MSICKQRTLPVKPRSSNISSRVASKDFLTPGSKVRINRGHKVVLSDNSSPSCASFRFKPQPNMVTPKSSNHYCMSSEGKYSLNFDDKKLSQNVFGQNVMKPRRLKVLVANDNSF